MNTDPNPDLPSALQPRYHQLLDALHEVVFACDEAGRLTFVNQEWTASLGHEMASTLGLPLLDFVVLTSQGARIDAALALRRTTRMADDVSLLFRHRDGSTKLLGLSCRYRKGLGTAGSLTDVTSVKQAQEALRTSHEMLQERMSQRTNELRETEARLRLITENARDVITMFDLQGRFVHVSPSCEVVLGYPADTALELNAIDLVHPDDRPVAFAPRGTPTPSEFRVRHANGSWVWMEGSMHTVAWGGGVYTVAISRDISQRKRLEDQLRQSQKMEAIGQLAGGVAHDFNNLLTVIEGYSRLLLRQLARSPLRADVQEIVTASGRAATLTRQLLAFSRRQLLNPQVLELGAVVAGMQGMLKRLVSEDVDLRTVPPPHPCHVRADPGQVEQVIVNLVVNARDAMPEGGAITLSVATLDRPSEGPDAAEAPFATLTVTDTGTGMSSEVQSHIFEPFYTTKPVGKGTGLGLSTVYGIVQQSGGTITVRSTPGFGSTFVIALPLVEAVAEALAPDVPAHVADGSETILLVEDQDEVRQLTRKLLQEHGYVVRVAGNAAEAIAMVEQGGPPSLLVTDIVMPGMNGRALADFLGQRHPHLKVLFISGYANHAVVQDNINNDGFNFLGKPYTPDELRRMVRKVLDARPASWSLVGTANRTPD